MLDTRHIPSVNEINLEKNIKAIERKADIVSVKSIEELRIKLYNIERNNQIIVQIGECAETFSQCNKKDIYCRYNVIKEFAEILNNKTINIGRIAGQYSKPRSSNTEKVKNSLVTSYLGDMLNSYNIKSREINVNRVLKAYKYSLKTTNYLKRICDFGNNFFSSHEALFLPYEEALTKKYNNKYYNTSAHMLWLGNRTRFLNSSHVEYLKGIENPIGIKVGALVNNNELVEIIKKLNPKNIFGKIILIFRFGINNIEKELPLTINYIKRSKLNVLYVVDAMHGNTYTQNNIKTRSLEDILKEVKTFYNLIKEQNLYFGGIHLEATYLDIKECTNNNKEYLTADNYKTYCDPRLNKKQTLEVAKCLKNLMH